jgi:hypothetical protein
MASVLRKLMSVTWPWALAATVLVAGFMYWLYAESSAIESELVVADTAAAVRHVSDAEFVADPTQFSRGRILLSPVTVRERIGRAALTVDMAGLEGYPLILERPVMESGITVVPGDNLAVAGQVYALNDSLLDVYAQRGFFSPENRGKLERQATFFLVDSLDLVFPEPEGTVSGEGSPGRS